MNATVELSTRMPPITREQMTDAQRAAADELIAGPRKGVKGPFIALMRSPELMARLQKVGEFLRFQSTNSTRACEFATLVVSRQWTQQFEWYTHVPLALKAGTLPETIATLSDGRRPATMSTEEALVFDFVTEIANNKGVCDTTFRECVEHFGETGVIELTALAGYFVLISMVLNIAHIPEEKVAGVTPLPLMPR